MHCVQQLQGDYKLITTNINNNLQYFTNNKQLQSNYNDLQPITIQLQSNYNLLISNYN